jgi:hypothetical protein
LKRLVFLAALALSACAGGNRGPDYRGGPPLKPSANPSAVIAAELAFNQLAQTKGQWTAFRATAAMAAEMFVPDRVAAAVWLKGRNDPAISVNWQPTAVWSSCDGSYAATHGTWERPGSAGSFITIWQRQKDEKYKWLLDMSLADERYTSTPDSVAARIGDCGRSQVQREKLLVEKVAREAATKALAASGRRDTAFGSADDGTLAWTSRVGVNGERRFEVKLWNGTAFETVLDTSAALASR